MTPEGTAALNQFLSGAMMFGYSTAGLFFFRFYRQTADRLFLLFGIAFWIFGLNRVAMLATSDEVQPIFYVVRMLAFSVILLAIIDKNRIGPRSQAVSPDPPVPADRDAAGAVTSDR